jgi:hypothetical protein
MTLTEDNRSARKRTEVSRDRGSRRISQAVDARRRLDNRRVDPTQTEEDRFGSRDPRFGHLTRSHD